MRAGVRDTGNMPDEVGVMPVFQYDFAIFGIVCPTSTMPVKGRLETPIRV